MRGLGLLLCWLAGGGRAAAGPPAEPVVRFVALGDGGEGNAAQHAVAAAIAEVCRAKSDADGPGCDFALYLGDNFYGEGVESVDDAQFVAKFEEPYAGLDFPFMVVLGNHDYGSTSLEQWKADPQVAYSDRSEKWTLPDRHYSFVEDHARFLALDTNALMLESIWGDSGQAAWAAGVLGADHSTWRVAFGHHPYRSNGQHGDAGSYEDLAWLPVVNGASVAAFVEQQLCGQVDLYLSGHDHNRQWLEPHCGVELIVSGAAAKLTPLEHRVPNPVRFEDDQREGFVWIELRGRRLRGEVYDRTGQLDFVHELEKAAAPQ